MIYMIWKPRPNQTTSLPVNNL